MRRRILRSVATAAALALLATACTDSGTDGENETSDGEYRATIVRTEYGIPHITADDYGSLGFGQGYALAEDHICTLADQIVLARSERAKYLGPGDDDEFLNSDFAYRTMRVREISEESWDELSADARELITGYVAGYNQYLEETGADHVPGFCAGEPWVVPIEPIDLWMHLRVLMLLGSGSVLADYVGDAAPPVTDVPATEESSAGDPASVRPPEVLSNAWALGADRSAAGTGMLVANPHFPWEGGLRFWESHVTIPGELDAYGAGLIGAPLIQIGFNDAVAWSHTVSAGNRFTAYSLDLVPGDATAYYYDGEVRPMTSEEVTVEVLNEDGELESETRTMWSSHYGPILDFPGVGWTDERTMSFRDANINNHTALEQWRGMIQADSLESFQEAHATHQGIPWVNTVATSADGRAWYTDSAATPNLSREAITNWERQINEDPLVSTAANSRVVLLDGSDSANEWVEVDGARSPGLVPFSAMPQLERTDYVFNANDSFWVANAEAPTLGEYSPLHGDQGTPLSPRTRENALVLSQTGAGSPSGDDGVFDFDELTDAALLNRSFTATMLRDQVVERCRATPVVALPALEGADGAELAPAGDIDLTGACDTLETWDGRYDLDSVGAVLWREFLAPYGSADFKYGNDLWAQPFSVNDPIGTPSGLVAPVEGETDPRPDQPGHRCTALGSVGVGGGHAARRRPVRRQSRRPDSDPRRFGQRGVDQRRGLLGLVDQHRRGARRERSHQRHRSDRGWLPHRPRHQLHLCAGVRRGRASSPGAAHVRAER